MLWYDWGGLDRRAAADGCRLRHDAEPRRPAVRQGARRYLIIGAAHYKNTNAKDERANGVISDTLLAYANSRRDDWDSHLPLAFFIDHGARTPVSHSCRLTTTSPPASRRRTTRSGCARWS